MEVYNEDFDDQLQLEDPAIKCSITIAVILKRMVPRASFTPPIALVCAGINPESAEKKLFISSYLSKYQLLEKLYGKPNYSSHTNACFERYQFFVQYAQRWPSREQVKRGLHQLDILSITADNPRASAIHLILEDIQLSKTGDF